MKSSSFSGKILEEIAILSENSKNSEWVKALSRISWNEGPAKLEIRSYNKEILKEDQKKGWSKGIALDDDELNILTEALVSLGYGSDREIKLALKSRKEAKEKSKKEK